MSDPSIEPLFSAEQIRARVQELAERIRRDYDDAPLTFVCIAEGGLRFADDLLAALRRRGVATEAVVVRARRSDGAALGPLKLERFDPDAVAGRDVLVLDDLADEGDTLRGVLELVAEAEPRSLRSVVLLDKRERRRMPLRLDYVGFSVDSGWVVGYGMDLDGAFRELDWIGRVVEGTC